MVRLSRVRWLIVKAEQFGKLGKRHRNETPRGSDGSPCVLLPNTMIGVLGQYCNTAKCLMAIGVVASGPVPTLGHQRYLNSRDSLSSD